MFAKMCLNFFISNLSVFLSFFGFFFIASLCLLCVKFYFYPWFYRSYRLVCWRIYYNIVFCYHQFILLILVRFFFYLVFIFFFSPSFFMPYNYSVVCAHDERIDSLFDINKNFVKNQLPFYRDLHRGPAFHAPKSTDLEGLVDIEMWKGEQRIERVLFYAFLNYAVTWICSYYLYDSGEIAGTVMARNLVFRTLIEYRDMDWQCQDVKRINHKLNDLNKDLVLLLVDFKAVDKEYRKYLVMKDANFVLLRHTVFCELTNLKPVDFAWGPFTEEGFAALSYRLWDQARQEYIKDELLFEFGLMDIDLFFGYFLNRISHNIRNYNMLLRMKYGFEELDLARAGIKELSYEERVHYRTFAGTEMVLRYANYHALVNAEILKMYNSEFDRTLADFRVGLEGTPKGFILEWKEQMAKRLEERREETRNRYYRKES